MNELRQRDEAYRNEKLTQLARGQPCLVVGAVPNTVYHDRDTVVWCHSNQEKHGKGGSRKAHDCFGFFGCMRCHTAIDQGRFLLREDRRAITDAAMLRTRAYLVSHDLICCAEIRPREWFLKLTDEEWLDAWRIGLLRANPLPGGLVRHAHPV